ncbi:nuclear transport of RNA pol II C-terminus 1 domain containing protein [Nitzschia inconspicua]|uniref:Nuclear transport of RNA pol II C-terminus 1 domain containing protein n=1 Tax=Nitzschia inconspicua TaxID=303405 RepID=A0A9K3Q3N9_9STRA|nr:nuclear transport of RNA pol II C-terminus 1 domain containing protein [Nitzschia inconspicua]
MTSQTPVAADINAERAEALASRTMNVFQGVINFLRDEFAVSKQAANATTSQRNESSPWVSSLFSRMVQSGLADQVQNIQEQEPRGQNIDFHFHTYIDCEMPSIESKDEREQLIYNILLPLMHSLTRCYEVLDGLPQTLFHPENAPPPSNDGKKKSNKPPPPRGMLSLQNYIDVACLLEFAVCIGILPALEEHIVSSLDERVRYQLPKSLAGRIPRASLLWGYEWMQKRQQNMLKEKHDVLMDLAVAIAHLVLLDRFRPMLLPRHLTDIYAALFQAEQLSDDAFVSRNCDSLLQILGVSLNAEPLAIRPATVDTMFQAKAYQTLLLQGTKSPKWLRRRVSPLLTQLASHNFAAILNVFVPLQERTQFLASCQRLGNAMVEQSHEDPEMQQKLCQQLLELLTVAFPKTGKSSKQPSLATEIPPRSMAVIQTAWAMIDHFPASVVESNMLQKWKQALDIECIENEGHETSTTIHATIRQLGALCSCVPTHSQRSSIARFLGRLQHPSLMSPILRVACTSTVVLSPVRLDAERTLLSLTMASSTMAGIKRHEQITEAWIFAIMPINWDVTGELCIEMQCIDTKGDNELERLRVDRRQHEGGIHITDIVSQTTSRAQFFVNKILALLVPSLSGNKETQSVEDDITKNLKGLPSSVFRFLLHQNLAVSTSPSARLTASILLPILCERFSEAQLLFGNQEDARDLFDLIHHVLLEVKASQNDQTDLYIKSGDEDLFNELSDLIDSARGETLSSIASLVLSMLIAVLEMGSKHRPTAEEEMLQGFLPTLTDLCYPNNSTDMSRDEGAAMADMASYAMTLISSRKAIFAVPRANEVDYHSTEGLSLETKLRNVVKEAENDLKSTQPPLRARGMVSLGRLARGFSGALPKECVPSIVKELDADGNVLKSERHFLIVEILRLCAMALADSESYVFLAAVQTIVALCDLDPQNIIPLIATGIVRGQLELTNDKEESRIILSDEQRLKLTEALIFAIRRRAVTEEYFPMLVNGMLGRNDVHSSISWAKVDTDVVDAISIQRETTEFFSMKKQMNEDELSFKEKLEEQDLRLRTGGPMFEVEECEAVRSTRISVLAELVAASSPSVVAPYCHEFVPLCIDALQLDTSRLVTRAAALLARELYSCLLREAEDFVSFLESQDSMGSSESAVSIPLAKATSSAREDRLNTAMKVYIRGVDATSRNHITDVTTNARCMEAINLRTEAEKLGIFVAAEIMSVEECVMAKLPKILQLRRKGATETASNVIQINPRDILE